MIDDVRLALQKFINAKGVGYADLSRLIGRNPAYIQQFMKRGTPRKLEEGDRLILARYFGVDEAMLGGVTSTALSVRRARDEHSVTVLSRLALGASAGSGSLEDDERAVEVVAFDASWLRGLGVDPKRASIIRVDGESMASTLSDGDEIMVDHNDDAERLRDGIYVLRLDDVLMVKRLAMGDRHGRFSVLSDNPHYPNWIDIDPAPVMIVGRVVWICRRIG